MKLSHGMDALAVDTIDQAAGTHDDLDPIKLST